MGKNTKQLLTFLANVGDEISQHFIHKDLFPFIQKEFPSLAEKTIDRKIYQLKSKGILSHISRGIYSLTKKNDFTPELSPYLKRVFKKVKRDLPLGWHPMSCWQDGRLEFLSRPYLST